ncbi:hypothetical protein pb186bvf_020682 [Paramecium bursaria]
MSHQIDAYNNLYNSKIIFLNKIMFLRNELKINFKQKNTFEHLITVYSYGNIKLQDYKKKILKLFTNFFSNNTILPSICLLIILICILYQLESYTCIHKKIRFLFQERYMLQYFSLIHYDIPITYSSFNVIDPLYRVLQQNQSL